MNLITQCPSCQTRFKVAKDQLTTARGRVRCGHCNMIFNALEYLDMNSGIPRRDRQQPETSEPEQSVSHDTDTDKIFDTLSLTTQTRVTLTPPAEQSPFPPLYPLKQQHSEEEPKSYLPPRPGPRPYQQSRKQQQPSPTSHPTPSPSVKPAQQQPAAAARRRLVIEDATELELPQIEHYNPENYNAEDFVLDDYYRPEPGTPRNYNFNKLFSALGIVGIILLIGQLFIINRVNLSANFPDLAPAIRGACKLFNCTVPLPSNIDMLRTEWSESTNVPEHSNLLQIDAVLKNHAHYAQNYPMLELALKTKQDKVVARRQLTPKEFLKPSDLELGQFNADSEVRISLRLDVQDLNAVGYNLRWYYPQISNQ